MYDYFMKEYKNKKAPSGTAIPTERKTITTVTYYPLEAGKSMIESLTKDLCVMADALMANGVLNYGTTYTPDLKTKHKFMQVYGIDAVMQHGDQFVIEYRNSGHIEFTTHQNGFVIMCLIDYPTYQDWMRKHPNTPVKDWTGGADKHADVLYR